METWDKVHERYIQLPQELRIFHDSDELSDAIDIAFSRTKYPSEIKKKIMLLVSDVILGFRKYEELSDIASREVNIPPVEMGRLLQPVKALLRAHTVDIEKFGAQYQKNTPPPAAELPLHASPKRESTPLASEEAVNTPPQKQYGYAPQPKESAAEHTLIKQLQQTLKHEKVERPYTEPEPQKAAYNSMLDVPNYSDLDKKNPAPLEDDR